MYQKYVTEVPVAQIEKINISLDSTVIQKGENKQLQIKIEPQEASNHKLIYSSNNPKVARVDDKGNIYGVSSGLATITVKADENNVQSEIDISVYSKVTGIELDQKEIYIEVGEEFKINGIINPEDADEKGIYYSSVDNNIVTIDENGFIVAQAEGDTSIIATSKENSEIKAECKVNVVRKIAEDEVIFDSSLNVDNLYISGLDYNANTVLDIKQKITTNLEIQIINNKNQILDSTDLVGTGSKILIKENEKILKEYTIILYGDSNGDGKINSVDLLVLQRHILEIEPLEAIYRKASNINKNGKKPTSVDLLLIQRHILGLKLIQQF